MKPKAYAAPEQPAIRLRDVGVLRGSRWILKGATWEVPAGACVAILGPNGSGKSTLARILAAHLWPSEGEVEILGERFGQTELAALRRSIRLLQPAGPYDIDPQLTARQVVETGFFGTLGLYDQIDQPMRQQADRVLRQVGLGRIVDQRYAHMSSGERVRSLIARALVQRPKLLLLDEPTAGLDLLAREQVLATVQRLFDDPEHPTPTVVMITHHVEELPPATSQVMVLSEGRVAAVGMPPEVLRGEVLSSVYGCEVEVRQSAGRFYLEVPPRAWDGLLGG